MRAGSVGTHEGGLDDEAFSIEFGVADAEPYLVALRDVLDGIRLKQLAEEPVARGPAA